MVTVSRESLFVAAVVTIALSGCTTKQYNTNPGANFQTNIYSDNIAQIEIKEQVHGSACVSDFPFKRIVDLFGSEEAFLETYVKHDRSQAGHAKAAAAYNALTAGKGLSTDILVQPVWEVNVKHQVIITDTCATVVGFRGVIKGFKEATGKEAATLLAHSNISSVYPGSTNAISEQAIAPPRAASVNEARVATAPSPVTLDGLHVWNETINPPAPRAGNVAITGASTQK